MLKAGLMAREYGKLPSEVLGEHDLATGTRFHLDYDIYAATSRHIQEIREEQREQMDPNSSRVASHRDRKDMIQDQESRADQRESMEQAGMQAPSPDGQMSTLQELKQERAEAKQMQAEASEPAPERVDQDG
jgi:hypothetical protein